MLPGPVAQRRRPQWDECLPLDDSVAAEANFLGGVVRTLLDRQAGLVDGVGTENWGEGVVMIGTEVHSIRASNCPAASRTICGGLVHRTRSIPVVASVHRKKKLACSSSILF